MTEKYEFEKVEVQLGDTKELRTFKKVSNLKQSGSIGTIEFNYRDLDLNCIEKKANGEYEYQYFTCHAELYGRVVSKIKRV
jgi:hypothetical protein